MVTGLRKLTVFLSVLLEDPNWRVYRRCREGDNFITKSPATQTAAIDPIDIPTVSPGLRAEFVVGALFGTGIVPFEGVLLGEDVGV